MVQTRSARKGAGDRLALSRHEQLAGCPLCLPKRVAAPHCVGGQAGIGVHLQPVAVHCERVAARRAVVLEGVLPSASLAACLKAGTPPLPAEKLLEGHRWTAPAPPQTFRCGGVLLLSVSADVRSPDDVIAFEGRTPRTTRRSVSSTRRLPRCFGQSTGAQKATRLAGPTKGLTTQIQNAALRKQMHGVEICQQMRRNLHGGATRAT